MVKIKKQVLESYPPKKYFCPFKRKPSSTSQPANTISNVVSDQELEEDSTTKEEVE